MSLLSKNNNCMLVGETFGKGVRLCQSVKEKEMLVIFSNSNDPKDMRIGRLLGGLKEEIRDKLEAMHNLTYEGACNSVVV